MYKFHHMFAFKIPPRFFPGGNSPPVPPAYATGSDPGLSGKRRMPYRWTTHAVKPWNTREMISPEARIKLLLKARVDCHISNCSV